jgi:transcriptional regulator with XRE-family HTH domain
MKIGSRRRELREERKMPQRDVEKATGLLRCSTGFLKTGLSQKWRLVSACSVTQGGGMAGGITAYRAPKRSRPGP